MVVALGWVGIDGGISKVDWGGWTFFMGEWRWLGVGGGIFQVGGEVGVYFGWAGVSGHFYGWLGVSGDIFWLSGGGWTFFMGE